MSNSEDNQWRDFPDDHCENLKVSKSLGKQKWIKLPRTNTKQDLPDVSLA